MSDGGGGSQPENDRMRVEPTAVHEETRGEGKDDEKIDDELKAELQQPNSESAEPSEAPPGPPTAATAPTSTAPTEDSCNSSDFVSDGGGGSGGACVISASARPA